MADTATKETPQTKATLRYLRTSAYKVREVLDLIRGLDVDDARHVLQFSERGPAREVLKVLNSAVANADHTLNIPADELKVAVAFADEGPTIKRWRPRARGRATRIRKRTCHITIIVSRLPEDKLERTRTKDASRPGSRAARVAGQQLEQEGRRRRRRNRKGGEGVAEEAGIVDQQEAAVDQAELVEGDEVVLEDEGVAEEQGAVDATEAVAEAAEEVRETEEEPTQAVSENDETPSDATAEESEK